jgi:purine-binding chemotaxis protein CheW
MNSVTALQTQKPLVSTGHAEQIVTFVVDGQSFGLSALMVRDVLRRPPLTRVPLAKPEIAGAINLRGHIVPAIDVRARLGLPPSDVADHKMSVVVEKGGDPYCLIVDSVGDVITLNTAEIEALPASVPSKWAAVSRGIYRMDSQLLLLLDVEQLLG